jgi:hypothetical protein
MATAKSRTPARQSPTQSTPPAAGQCITAEEWIATAAYYRAAARGFSPGQELDDRVAAEQSFKAALEARE